MEPWMIKLLIGGCVAYGAWLGKTLLDMSIALAKIQEKLISREKRLEKVEKELEVHSRELAVINKKLK